MTKALLGGFAALILMVPGEAAHAQCANAAPTCLTYAHTQKSIAAPSGNGNGSPLMLGLAASITPTATGNVRITITGNITQNTSGDGCNYQIRTGTGTAPANAAAATGTTRGSNQTYTAASNTDKKSFALNWTVTGLTLGVPLWIDEGLNAITGSSCTETAVDVVADEIP